MKTTHDRPSATIDSHVGACGAFDRDGLTFSGGRPGAVVLLGPEEREVTWTATPGPQPAACRRQTPLGLAEDYVSTWTFMDHFKLEWHVTRLERWPGFTVRTVLTNESPAPIRVRRLGILQAPAPAFSADADDWFVLAPFCGWQNPGEGPLAGFTGGVRTFQDAVSLTSRQGERGLFVAAVGPAESDVTIALQAGEGGQSLSVASEMTDIVVDPGESRTSEEVLFLFAPHLEAYDAVLRWLASTHGARTHRGPFTGWCSWYEQYSNITAAHVQAVAHAVREQRDLIPQAVIQIDEGYQRHWGDWHPNAKFPEGWKPVVEAIREAGAIPGVWLAPLGVFDVTGVIHEHPDWFQLQAGAFEPNGGNWREGTLHYLDPTHPGAQQFIRNMIRNARAEGFRYFKIDFNHVNPARYHDPKATRFQALRRLYRLYREEMGEDTYLNSCIVGLSRAVMGLADSMRIGGDSDYHWTGGCGILDAICGTTHTAPGNGAITTADPDVYYLKARGDLLTTAQLQSWQGFVGLLGGINMTSEPLHRPDYAEALRELEICTPPVPEHGHSFLPGMETHPSLFGFIADRAWGRFASVMLFNARDTTGDVALDAPALNALGECHLWSFRDGAYLGCASGNHLEKALPAWGNRIIRMTPVCPNDGPVLIGSDLHIGMGAAEVTGWVAGPDTLDIALSDAGARSGSLWIHSGKPLVLEQISHGSATVEAIAPDLWRIHLQDRRRGCGQKLRLAVGRSANRLVPSESAAPVQFTLAPVTPPEFGMQGRPSTNGVVNLTIAAAGITPASGEIVLATKDDPSVAIVPDLIPYRLLPGETMTQAITLIPRQQAAHLTLAARRSDTARWSAWAFMPMARLALNIPGAADDKDALRAAAEAVPALTLPAAQPVADLRLAASGRQLFASLHVRDAQPKPNPDVFWQGSCVELFVAMPGTKNLCQFYFQPDAALSVARCFQILSTRSGQTEAHPEVHPELARTVDGYDLSVVIPFELLGLSSNTREFLLDFQVTRRVNDQVRNTPLLGGPEACASNSKYAHITVVDPPSSS